MRRKAVVALLLASGLVTWAGQPAGAVADPGADNASCLGLGSSFYGTFAPQQRAFVAQFVVDQADAAGVTPGATYRVFAGEKEGGSIPAPCGTRLE
jgi:hypothetical protein